MTYTCPKCNGMGIVNYDSDLPRFQQEHCPVCEGEGVISRDHERKSFEEIKEQLEADQQNNAYEPIEKIGLEPRDFTAFINSIEEETGDSVFTIRILEDEEDPKEKNPHLYCLIVFESREILKSKISTFLHEDKLAIRTQGKWL